MKKLNFSQKDEEVKEDEPIVKETLEPIVRPPHPPIHKDE